MPPLPQLRFPALAELDRQLRFAPADALRRHLDRVEALVGEIDPQREYPIDWVNFRITGYRSSTPVEPAEKPVLRTRPAARDARPARPAQAAAKTPSQHMGPQHTLPPDAGGEAGPVMISGRTLLSDLSALAERLSDAAGLTWAQVRDSDRALDADELCARWSVSRKTLERYRRAGLPARRVSVERGLSKLAFLPAVVERFEKLHRPRMERAAGFSRIDAATRGAMLRRAAVYRRRFNCSLNQAALRLARRYGRSHEAVRQLLMRHDRTEAAGPAFARREPLRDAQRRVIWRATRRGIDAAHLAVRYHVTRAAVNRALNVERARRLHGLLASALHDIPANPIFDRPDAAEVLLAGGAVDGQTPAAPRDLLAWAQQARLRQIVTAADEKRRANAFHFLRARAARLIRELDPHHPSGSALDEAETSLRWAARVQAVLVRPQFSLFVESAELRFGRPLEELRSADLIPLVREGIAVIARAVEQHDPAKGGRLAGPAGLALNRFLARWLKEHPGLAGAAAVQPAVAHPAAKSSAGAAGAPRNPTPLHLRATPRLRSGVPIPDWTKSIAVWQAWLDPDPRIETLLGSASPPLEPRHAQVLAARYGLAGAPPMTQRQVAAMLGVPLVHAASLERRALRAALRLVREPQGATP